MTALVLGNPQKAAGTALVGLVVLLGGKGNAAESLKLANIMLELGNDLAKIESADAPTIINAATAATANLDPALGLAIGPFLIANATLVAGLEQVEENTPVGSLVLSWVTNFSAGMVAGAQAEVTKWTAKLPVTPPASTPASNEAVATRVGI